MAEEIQQSIAENAAGPRSVMSDGQSVNQHSLADQIAADKYLDEKAARNKRKLPIRLARITPGGTV
jgi:hypothetical protein